MVQIDRTNLTPIGFRVVVAAWVTALFVAALLAIAAGTVRLAELAQKRAIAENEYQFEMLSRSLIPFFESHRSKLEQKLLSGRSLSGPSHTELDQDVSLRIGEERSIFRPEDPRRNSANSPAEVRVLRSDIDGAEIAPRFAGWTVRLKFVDDYLRGVSAVYPNRASLSRPIKAVYTVEMLMGSTIVIAGALALVCLVAAGSVGVRYRRQVAAVGLAGAVLVMVITSIHLARYRSPLLVNEKAAFAWLGVTLILGLAAYMPVRLRTDRRNNCRFCGYDLTGNVSGRCPECGQPTAQGQVDRWEAHAAAISKLRDDVPQFTGTVAQAPRLMELKVAAPADQVIQFVRALAGGPAACYRYNMSDAPNGSDPFDSNDSNREVRASGSSDDPKAETPPGVCPVCNYTITTEESPEESLTHCPACGADLEAARADAELQREQALRAEVERRQREQQLNSVHIKQVLTERRALFRTRSYFVVIGVGALAVASQLAIYTYYRVRSDGLSFRAGVYLAAILAMLVLVRICWRKVRRYNAELSTSLLPEPVATPDFSTLSDGTQRLDTAADNLERLFKRD